MLRPYLVFVVVLVRWYYYTSSQLRNVACVGSIPIWSIKTSEKCLFSQHLQFSIAVRRQEQCRTCERQEFQIELPVTQGSLAGIATMPSCLIQGVVLQLSNAILINRFGNWNQVRLAHNICIYLPFFRLGNLKSLMAFFQYVSSIHFLNIQYGIIFDLQFFNMRVF